ncbi:MAG: hypothetical protein CL992_02615 [Euryarchaeota archaeon]|nr:hypothetical protein [Euryarchaeota archaeon]
MKEDGVEQLWRVSARVRATENHDYGVLLGELQNRIDPILTHYQKKIPAVSAMYCGGVPLVHKAQHQLMDDLIDVLTDSDTLGKPSGSDVAQGKRTLMVIHALKQPDSPAKQDLLAALGKGEEVTADMANAAHEALHQLGSIDYAKRKAESYHRKAHQCLDMLPDGPAIRALRELTDYQLKRIF